MFVQIQYPGADAPVYERTDHTSLDDFVNEHFGSAYSEFLERGGVLQEVEPASVEEGPLDTEAPTLNQSNNGAEHVDTTPGALEDDAPTA